MVSCILSFIKMIRIYALKSTNIHIFYLHFLDLDNSINIVHSLLTFSVVILDMIMEGTVSQIFYLGPNSHFI